MSPAWAVGCKPQKDERRNASMKGPWSRVLGIALGAVIACAVVAPRLHAGPEVQGKFTLPFNAKWGKISLPAGDYTLAVNRNNSMVTVVIAQSGRNVGVTLPEIFDYTENKSKTAELVCVRHNGMVTVRELRLPQIGTYYFPLPKELTMQAAQQPQMIETVAVQSVGE
jgi:hypothetical protein